MKAVLKHAGRWLHFQHPEKVLCATTPDEVLSMLREAEASGLFAAGFISYEAAPAFDAALTTKPSDGFPLLCLGLFRAPEVLDKIEEPADTAYALGPLEPSVTREDFVQAIEVIKEQIAAGATYQVNYTYRLESSFSGNPRAFFHALVRGQKTEYAAYLEFDDWAVCSASPELFFHARDGRVVSRPMKGTAPRGRTFAEDWQQAEALKASEKDRAENIMIVDMIRNDIGRIAVPGSVETVSRFDVEKYPTLWQMTSTVCGRVDATPSNLFKALFPCASITGAPKVKTMEIIRDLEVGPRRIYTGAIGFMTPQQEASFNVAIRTALVNRATGRLEFGVGGGIVWDSEPAAEYDETLTKARVLTQPRPDFKLLETMLWSPDAGIYLQDAHLQRLGKSAAYFDVPMEPYAVMQALENKTAGLPEMPHRIRLLISRDGMVEVQTFPTEEGRACSPSAPWPAGAVIPDIRVAVATEPVNSDDVFLFHKTTHRPMYDKALAAFPNCDDVLLWNERGEVTEGCLGNVVVRRNGRLLTPPVGCGLLAGTFRDALLQDGLIEEAVLRVEDLSECSEVFLVNSVRRWQKAVMEEPEVKQ